MALTIKHRVTIDMSHGSAVPIVPFHKGDSGAHVIVFSIRNGGEVVLLPDGVTASVTVKNGKGTSEACTVDNAANTITYSPTPEALSVSGNIPSYIKICDNLGAAICTPHFIFSVIEEFE